jgi:hypothetical protein
MRLIKRLLLFAAVGTVSIVLAGCYGVPARHRCGGLVPRPDSDSNGPIPELETAPAQMPE